MGEALIPLALIAVIVGGACLYIMKSKKAGNKCIGCPHGGSCSGGCSGANNQPTVDDDDELDLD